MKTKFIALFTCMYFATSGLFAQNKVTKLETLLGFEIQTAPTQDMERLKMVSPNFIGGVKIVNINYKNGLRGFMARPAAKGDIVTNFSPNPYDPWGGRQIKDKKDFFVALLEVKNSAKPKAAAANCPRSSQSLVGFNIILKDITAEQIQEAINEVSDDVAKNPPTVVVSDATSPITKSYRFYQSYEDYKNNKPVEGITVKPFSWSELAGEKIKVVEGGTGNKFDDKGKETEKTLLKDLKYKWFTYGDYGTLMRIYKNEMYYTIVDGTLCYYISAETGDYTTSDGSYYFTGRQLIGPGGVQEMNVEDFYSEGIDGEINRFHPKKLEPYLIKFNLLEQYKKDFIKREFQDNVSAYNSKVKTKSIKYIKLINEQMEKK